MAISPEAQAALDRLTQAWGQPLAITSGYRDPGLNARVGGAKNSQHMHGNAFDISVANMSPEERLRLASLARDAGFQGFGFYNNSLHFDVGAPRAWGPSYGRESIPSWAADWVSQNVGGSARGNVTMSTSGGQNMGLMDYQQEPQTFGERLREGWRSGSLLENLALAFNSMRMNPDPNLAQFVQSRQERRETDRTVNRTAQWLMSQGREDLARAMLSGAIDPKTAASVALAPPDKPNVMEVGGKLVDETGRVIYDSTGGAAPMLTSDQLSGLNTLRDDATTTTAELRAMSDAWTNIETFYQNPGAVSDRALVIAFAKVLDPTSVVRESESAAIANSGSLDEGMKALLLNALQGGGALPPAIRDEIMKRAYDMYANKMPGVQKRINMLQETARRAGLPPELVFYEQLTPPAPPAGAATPPPNSSTFIPAGTP